MTLDYVEQIKRWRYNGYVKEIYMQPYIDSYDETNGEMKGPDDCIGYAVLQKIDWLDHSNIILGTT